MSQISGKEMGKSLDVTVRRYVELGILEGESCNAVGAAVSRLKQAKHNTSWDYNVSKGEPIKFKDCTDPKSRVFNPLIMVENISVDTSKDFPYRKWIAVLVFEYKERGRRCPRWHFDLGNAGQPGPRLHLQYGGHHHEDRCLDEPLKAPRWSSFPLDTILLMEIVAANFFETVWKEKLRDDRSLRKNIKLSEGLCYGPLSRKLHSYLDGINGVEEKSTFLGGCWND